MPKQQLATKYPNTAIFENKVDGVVAEILCEVEPTSNHQEYSFAIAVIDKSIPHYHKEIIETYKVIKEQKIKTLMIEPTTPKHLYQSLKHDYDLEVVTINQLEPDTLNLLLTIAEKL